MADMTDFEKLIGTRRANFPVTLETDDGPVVLTLNYPKKTLQAILLDCDADDKAIKFLLRAGDGFDYEDRPSGDDVDLALQSAGAYCLRNELVTPDLTDEQVEQLIDNLAPRLFQSFVEQVQTAISDNLQDAAKN